jgi:FKBP-type peptidyl-prolyl cis-trans isomerase
MCLLALFSSCDRKVRETVVAEKTTVTESQDDTTSQSALQDRFTAISSLEKPTSLDDQFSYTYGYMLFLTLKNQFSNLDGSYFARGAVDAVGGAAFFTQDEMTAILKQVQEKMLAQANDEQKRLAEKNLEDSKAFLQTNKTADGVVTLDNGVEYKIVSPGDGGKPLISDNDIVTMNYSISLIDGSLVESTWHRGHTETVRVSTIQQSTIKEGLEMMRPGGHYLLWIPPELAYGEQGNGVIGPNQVLVVELEIVAVATPTVL